MVHSRAQTRQGTDLNALIAELGHPGAPGTSR